MTNEAHTPPSESTPDSSQPLASGPSLAGRLFVVPAIVVTALICLAIVVVMFGGSAVGQRQSIEELLKTLESGSGAHTAGVMLLPADREVWQAAQELATRLLKKGVELPADQVAPTAERISRILADIDAKGPSDDAQRPKQAFLLLALARLDTPAAVDTLTRYLTNSNQMIRQYALRGVAEMKASPAMRQRIGAVLPLLDDPAAEVQMVACLVVAELAERGDERVTRALRDKLAGDREVQWNAALALARLGNKSGKLVLLNMLDRAFWEKGRVQYQDASQSVDRAFTPIEIANYLSAAVTASSGLDDADLRAAISKLTNDTSEPVRRTAREALAGASGTAAPAEVVAG